MTTIEEVKERYEYADLTEDGKVRIKPNDRRGYQIFPVRDEQGELLAGVIEVTAEEFEGILNRSLMFNDDLTGVVPFALSAEEMAAKDAEEAEYARQARVAEIRARMAELDYDINACADGVVKAKTEAEYRAERVALRNELRAIEGKAALPLAEV